MGDTGERDEARRGQRGLLDGRVRILLEEAQEPPRRDPLVPAWIFAFGVVRGRKKTALRGPKAAALPTPCARRRTRLD